LIVAVAWGGSHEPERRSAGAAAKEAPLSAERGRDLGGTGDPFVAVVLTEIGQRGLGQLDERLVGDAAFAARAFEDRDAACPQPPEELAAQAALAHSGWSGDQRQVPRSLDGRPIVQGAQLRQLGLSSDERRDAV
jgi:hypothetical protein